MPKEIKIHCSSAANSSKGNSKKCIYTMSSDEIEEERRMKAMKKKHTKRVSHTVQIWYGAISLVAVSLCYECIITQNYKMPTAQQ